MKMIAKRKTVLPFNNLEAITNCKEHFLSLCKMYEHLGKLLALQFKALTHPMFAKSVVHQTQARMAEQYNEIGEELKNVGTYLDLTGGKSVMKAEESEPKKKTIKKKKDTYVSNIAPPKKKEKENEHDHDQSK